MKLIVKLLAVLCIALCFTAALLPKPVAVVSYPPVVTPVLLDESLGQYVTAWRTDVARRFPNAVLLCCHGGTFVHGEWLVKATDYELPAMTVDQLLNHFRMEYPTRTLVLLACNPHHLYLHGHPNCFYALDSVWCVPDRAVLGELAKSHLTLDDPDDDPAEPSPTPPATPIQRAVEDRWASDPGVFGNIFEFVSAE